MRVAIAVCTAARPKMLRACLDSILAQEPPLDSEIDILVIDNNRTPDARPVAEFDRGKSPIRDPLRP